MRLYLPMLKDASWFIQLPHFYWPWYSLHKDWQQQWLSNSTCYQHFCLLWVHSNESLHYIFQEQRKREQHWVSMFHGQHKIMHSDGITFRRQNNFLYPNRSSLVTSKRECIFQDIRQTLWEIFLCLRCLWPNGHLEYF